MVLFIFIIMLLDLKAEQRRQLHLPILVGGAAIVAVFVAQLVTVLHRYPAGNQPFPEIAANLPDAHNIGMTLFANYNLPFQVIGVLILVASIGVVVLSQRELK
jgi:NADH-quinone oxidoreductase subunit J